MKVWLLVIACFGVYSPISRADRDSVSFRFVGERPSKFGEFHFSGTSAQGFELRMSDSNFPYEVRVFDEQSWRDGFLLRLMGEKVNGRCISECWQLISRFAYYSDRGFLNSRLPSISVVMDHDGVHGVLIDVSTLQQYRIVKTRPL